MTFEEIFAIDTSNMYSLIRRFPEQVEEAIRIGNAAKPRVNVKGIQNILLCGLGGSAIGGDLLKSYLAGELKVPFVVNRHYTLPEFVGRNSLVIISSYSGNTEETTAAFKEAIKRRAKILCISSGGAVEKLAKKRRTPLIKIPGGLPPRAALGYSFFPLLITLGKLGLIKNKSREIHECVTLLKQKSDEYGSPDPATNKAMLLAEQLRGRVGIVYSSTERFDAVATRWRGQMAENGKSLMFGHVLPEMNHNELVGWKTLTEQMREMQVMFLHDRADHPRVRTRMDITKGVIAEYTQHITEVWSDGTSLLARMFSLVYLGDWVSFYLAMLHNVDPTPVKVIDYLKDELSKV
ncbi:MAG TPA: bifunctional phosphoglucose/phosphomannose isomerase [Bacteroidetes bacterium]|jgi:glucose/mannose-6-phosphate isomerase|nr:bifunctional phosphoglucose/phosphomannose isomerase [Bacteroidota bacterium]